MQCGTLTVPLDRADPANGTLTLAVERLRARGARRGVMILLAGGPGQAGTPIEPDDPVAEAIPGWDLVMLDQRGTGTRALRCRALDAPGSSETSASVGQCAIQIGPRRAFFTSRDSVLDIEALREGLGVDLVALGGISYGTYVSQYYAQEYPSRVTHLVLDSVVDPATFDGIDAPMLQAAAPVLTALCAHGRCAGITPDPVGDLTTLVAATSTQPLRGWQTTDRGRAVRTSIGGPGNQDDLPLLLAAGDLNPGLREMWPGAVRAARGGDAAPLLRLATIALGGEPSPAHELSAALFYATACADAAVPWTTATPVDQRDPLLTTRINEMGPAAFAPFSPANAIAASIAGSCREWPEGNIDPLVPTALPPVPILILNGGQDVRTPVASARAVGARATNAHLVIAPGAGHSLLYAYTCARTQMRNLLYGRPVSTAGCNREARIPNPIPVPPATLDAVRPAGAPGMAGRVMRAARLAIQDGVLTLDAAIEAGLDAVPGIRGGLARESGLLGDAITYSRFSAVRGVAVSGTLRFNGRTFEGSIRVSGPGGWDGILYLARGGERAYTGSIGGTPVHTPLD